MDAATELTWTYLQRVLRWWAGKGPAAHLQCRGRGALAARGTRREPVRGCSMAASKPPTVPQSARTPHHAGGWLLCRRTKTSRQNLAGCCVESSAHRPSRLILTSDPQTSFVSGT
ncbi:hypothetical protein XpiCFBP4643_02125 [Xanthomonas pisi]|uniref:Uncharacterized protein n=1 Tax=Xanthomonas pisi TaxID=56457 RepID=A0A2S7D760_9XANT|nr:hypothetical protein XpiCFBP4643_02125 [Xanthomonas pisi]